MARSGQTRPGVLLWAAGLGILLGVPRLPATRGQEQLAPPTPVNPVPKAAPVPGPPLPAGARPLPINLAAALKLGNAQALDIAYAVQQERAAAAELAGAQVLWLPTLYLGTDYFRHDGPNQDTAGNIIKASRDQFMVGVGPSLVFSLSEAIFAPLAARQVVSARQAAVQVATNDTLLAVAQSYFTVEQARGELAGSLDALRQAEGLLRRVEELAPQIVPALEVTRARSDLRRRRQSAYLARDRWRQASADLVRVLNLDPVLVVDPVEPSQLQITLVSLAKPLDELVALAWINRPELAARQALVQASLEQLRQDRWRPLLPSVLLRGASTPVTGTLTAGWFGGGPNDEMGNFGMRQDWDLQVLWQLRNLGFGDRAVIRRREAENQAALIDFQRTRNLVAAQVAQALSLAQTAAGRVLDAEAELKDARLLVRQTLLSLRQTGRLGNVRQLLVRPQEAVAAIDALYQAYQDYFGAVADSNRAQFQLYRALGQPAQQLLADGSCLPQASDPAPPPPPARPLGGPPEVRPASWTVRPDMSGPSYSPGR